MNNLQQQASDPDYSVWVSASAGNDYDLEIEPKELFFTKDGKKRKSLLSKELTQKYPKLLLELEKLTSQIYKLDEEYRIEELEYHTNLLCKLAYILLEKYEKFKEENNLLDYDDLIYYTEKLFENKAIHEWLSHKLESEINHILVDEAQDKSRNQWNIITTLITEFNRPDSSIFIVGDDKQSIYSFQGADLANFNLVNEKLETNLAKANKKFKKITLEYSYRSWGEILQFTHQVFKYIKAHYSTLFLSDNPVISAFRTHTGSVTVWSLVTSEKQEELFWALPQDYANALSSADLLIEKIISFIKEKIASKEILPATGNPISEKDFMILVRKRDEFSNNLIKELNKANLKVKASDKVNLKEHLSMMDLISVAKFVLLPYDDLNLAALLKSPIIGISEQQLYELLMNKNDEIANTLNLHIDDMVNELLTLSSNYANDMDNSLQGFVAWFENNDIWIKRDMEHSDKIRVMTVHGSKGLEAPIVILCDSTTLPISSSKFIWHDNGEIDHLENAANKEEFIGNTERSTAAYTLVREDASTGWTHKLPLEASYTSGRMFFSANAADTPEFLQKMKDAEKLKDLQEYIRLLYVAMTRAKDHLVICGFSNKSNIPENLDLICSTISSYVASSVENKIDAVDKLGETPHCEDG
ncbi:ATP-dependent helicase/nuclease subunit A-like [Chrysoperla carnea]|uniref:ATP-dependent helicase/nuclease subunit A-like n=1 Tax=Chrysoperla carnea TaxID=189513 RepID=UPI001D063D6F|nr:ATP-dependent helicase/nuclease subunit A-like [Chrysoperla carnea]